MNCRPILFSGPMVRALLDGSKTQTRRVVKPQPVPDGNGGASWYGRGVRWAGKESNLLKAEDCPYGQPGDRLWVRETWQGPLLDDDATENPDDIESPKYCFYAADGGPAPEYEDSDGDLHCCWRPSIHMPRWASRITLEITSVRVERLQDISEADAAAEGVYTDPSCPAYDAYEALWEQINGPGSWSANPFVWVVEFKRIAP